MAIGGGHGLARALRAITTYAGSIHAIVTVADDGGSSGRLTPALDIPPPGDIRQCLVALTPDDSPWRRLFSYRFAGGDVDGHALGNLIIAALADLEGSFAGALAVCERLLGTVGEVVPASPVPLRLEATVDGRPVAGQVRIARSRGRIEALRVLPETARAAPEALAAIRTADQIVLGPGSLYTSLMAALLVPGITAAIEHSAAQLVLVMNLTTQDGETLGMDAADHLGALLRLTGVRPPAAMVASDAPVDVAPPLEAVSLDAEAIATYGVDLVTADLLDREGTWPAHDPLRLGTVLGRLASTEPGR